MKHLLLISLGSALLIAGLILGLGFWDSYAAPRDRLWWDAAGFHESGNSHGRWLFGHGPVDAKWPSDFPAQVVYPLGQPYAEFLGSGKSELQQTLESPGRWTHIEFWSAEDYGAWVQATANLSRQQVAISHAFHVVAVQRGSFFYGWIALALTASGFVLLVFTARPLGKGRAALSLLLVILTAAALTAWVRSAGRYDARDAVMHGTPVGGIASHHVSLSILHGKLLFDSATSWTDVGDGRIGWLFGKATQLSERSLPPTVAGFGFDRYHFSNGYTAADGTRAAVPLWALIPLLAAYPLLFILNSWRRRRHAQNPHACPICGYDLRASTRCPECGHTPAASPVRQTGAQTPRTSVPCSGKGP